MQIRLDIGAFYVTQDVAVSVAFLITEIAEFGMLCGAGLVSIALDGDGPGAARACRSRSTRSPARPIATPRFEERFERIVTGLARQLRSTLDHDPARGLYAVSIAVVGRNGADRQLGPTQRAAGPAAGARRDGRPSAAASRRERPRCRAAARSARRRG